ncbi:MAG: hypothetical protein KDA25_05675, partial [Phycisphaerales bacterium]|nr:hypothetical protein [Phycisphaerales bacterium]
MRLFRNRAAAGSELAHDLSYFASDDPIVLGIPNGGVPVASVVAQALKAPLDILLISRLHSPKGGRHIVGAVDE